LGDPSGFQATTPRLARIIVLMNERTQLPPTQAAIAEAIAAAPAGRFVWLTQQGKRLRLRNRCPADRPL